jgi:hypothetical protein
MNNLSFETSTKFKTIVVRAIVAHNVHNNSIKKCKIDQKDEIKRKT